MELVNLIEIVGRLLALLYAKDLDPLRRAVSPQPIDPLVADIHIPIVTTNLRRTQSERRRLRVNEGSPIALAQRQNSPAAGSAW
jgi:hypothetical protein